MGKHSVNVIFTVLVSRQKDVRTANASRTVL